MEPPIREITAHAQVGLTLKWTARNLDMLNECLGLHNNPQVEVLPGHKLTGPKNKKQKKNLDTLVWTGYNWLRTVP
jgi:hypothetical protein